MYEGECNALKRVRPLSEIRYAERMGEGAVIKTDDSLGEWTYIPPDNPINIIFPFYL